MKKYRSNLRAFTGKNQGMTEFRASGGYLGQLQPGPRERFVQRAHQIYGFADGGETVNTGLFKWLPTVQHTLQRGLSGLVPGVPPPPSPGLPGVEGTPVRNLRPASPTPVAGGVRMRHGGRVRRLAQGGVAAETMTRRMPVTGFSGASGEYVHALKQYGRTR